MCTVSAVMGDWFPKGPLDQLPGLEGTPNQVPWVVVQKDPELAKQMLRVIELLEQIDAKVNAIDCRLKEAEKELIKAKLKEIAEGL